MVKRQEWLLYICTFALWHFAVSRKSVAVEERSRNRLRSFHHLIGHSLIVGTGFEFPTKMIPYTWALFQKDCRLVCVGSETLYYLERQTIAGLNASSNFSMYNTQMECHHHHHHHHHHSFTFNFFFDAFLCLKKYPFFIFATFFTRETFLWCVSSPFSPFWNVQQQNEWIQSTIFKNVVISLFFLVCTTGSAPAAHSREQKNTHVSCVSHVWNFSPFDQILKKLKKRQYEERRGTGGEKWWNHKKSEIEEKKEKVKVVDT